MDDTPLRVRFWYSNTFDKQLQEVFRAHLRDKLHDWKRAASGHRNISPFHGLVESPGWGKVPSLVVPLYEMDINDYVHCIPQADPLLLLLKVADALAYMHSLDPPVVHGAIRGKNIHIDQHGEPMLVDLGLEHLPRAYGASEDQHDRDHLRWLAPEIIDPPESDVQEQDVSYYYSTPETDVWSFGMTILEVLSGKMPWANFKRNPSVVYHLIQGSLPQRPQVEAITDLIWDLILLCVKQEPCQRINMNGVRSYLQLYVLLSHVPKHLLLPH
ncbi:putative serine/threonine-protein kinase samkB [Termitomyces sp. T112]|nr:putative serine/threonine-protein kinase samkB [Termitomyces sp. T112]KNZ74696.1 putative serine/threonine-protein kinase samkB [Termitomyces sp. J132]